ncbi:MAG: acyloxyacyl hydrolase [Proteobacteria bacterium]|nr:acyloxyacyl hydrolase [Pseudomonadota bacterium]
MKKVSWFLCALLFSGNVLAVDGVLFELGNGSSTDTARAGAIFNFERQWFTEGDWLVAGFWEATAGQWQGRSAAGNNQTITDLAVTPVFRLQQKNPSSFSPYLEGAIGFHLISPTFIYANRQFGSAFQFGDHVGAGVRFGEHQQFDLGYRYQHISNGGLKKPNQGINLNELHFVYHF